MLNVHVLLDQCMAVISDSDSLLKFSHLLFAILDHMLQPITLSGKIFRHSKIVLLCQQSLYLVEVQIANACCIFLLLLTIGVDLLLQAFLLFLQILAERYALGRFILIEKFLRHPVQLFQYSFLQMADRNKRTGTGFHRDMPIRTLQIVPVLRLGGPKRIAAICAPCFACENTNFSITERSAALCSPPTYLVPQFLVNNRLVRTTHNIPLIFRTRLTLLGFIRHTAILALHHIADVNFIFQHIRNRKVFPQGAVFAHRLLVA